MPAPNVSYNSSRVQRAYRINNIETLKLNHRIQLLEKERLHRQRLTNQDIRLISLTLDYIQTCSGSSQEGMAPEMAAEEEDEPRQEKGQCFLYGERIVSRKKRRTIRPQSAIDSNNGISLQNSETSSVVSSTEFTIRPQSSPIRRKPPFITQIQDDVSEAGTNSESIRSGASTPRFKPSWTDEEPSDITKILLKARSDDAKRPASVFERSRDPLGKGSAALKALTRSLRISSHTVNKSQTELSADAQTFVPSRGANIMDILNGGKSSMSASAWKTHLSHRHSGPVTSSLQRKQILDTKKAWNEEHTELVQEKVKTFVRK